jgi:DGQHR domain-containing protein
MKIPALPFQQHGKRMYLGFLKASELAHYLKSGKIKVDVWTPDNPTGYQRSHSKTRSRMFARFISAKENISPLTLLLSARGVSDALQYSNGFLTIPDGISLYLTDGQHRARGIECAVYEFNANLDDVEVPIVIMPTRDSYEEAKQFVIINKTQKGVRTDLAERHLQQAVLKEGYAKLKMDMEEGKLPRAIFADIEWRPRAVEIVDELNKNSDVWKGRIRAPNVHQPTATVSQKSFTDSLEPFLTHPDFKDLPKDVQIKILENYWMAIRDIMKDAFIAPEDYLVQKTTGVFVFNGLLPTVAKYCKDPNTGKYELTYAKFKDVFSKISKSEFLQAESWKASQKRRGIIGGKVAQMGTSQKSFSVLRDILTKELEDAMSKEEEVKARVIV